MSRILPAFGLFLLAFAGWMPGSALALDNARALQGLEQVKTVYDVRKKHPDALAGYLEAIITNHENLLKEGVEPELAMVFIAKSVQYITTEPETDIEMAHQGALDRIARAVERLDALGVHMEACAAATRYYGVDNDTLLPAIEPVRSGFISVMGYQNRGYALVPVY